MSIMFRAAQANPYDDIVAKTTDENLTSENWEFILNLCDKVNDEGEQGARNVIAALLKRLTHRNANVQLYALALGDSLSKNCGIHVHREMASKAFTQSLEKIIADRTTHDKVKQKALSLIAIWASEFGKDPSLGLMEDCYNNLKAKNYKFQGPQEAPPPEIDDAVRRREEEELQKALEMSVRDKGGRTQWSDYSAYGSSSSSSRPGASSAAAGSSAKPAAASTSSRYSPPLASSGYVPAQQMPPREDVYTPAPAAQSYTPPMPVATPAPAAEPAPDAPIPIVTRVRALHAFEPTEAGELAFEKGDIIKVVDRGYKDWWRGQLKGRTGIFPVNYVEPLPEPTGAQLAQEAQQEASVFSQAANVDKLLTLLREFDGTKDNLADNEDIQELYRSTISLRPKIVKLIDKYSQKRADLVSMNESFVKAKSIYERMMEQSLAKIAESGQEYRSPFPPYGAQPGPGPQPYAWNQGGYDPQQAYGGYPQGPQGGHPGQVPNQHPYQQPYGASTPFQPPYGPGSPAPQQSGTPAPFLQQQGPIQPTSTPAPHVQGQQPQGYPHVTPPHGYPDPQQQQQQQQTYFPGPQAQGQPHPQAQMHAQPQGQPQLQGQPQFQPQSQPQAQMQAQPQPQAQAQAPPQQQQSGPPYVYDPNGTYPDENATAWARYFAQGGTDPTGAAYFFSVPGVKEAGSAPAPSATDPNAAAAAHRQGSMDTVVAGGYQSQPQVQAQTEPLQRHGTVGSTAPMSPGVDPSAAPQWSAGPTSPIGGAYPQGQPLAAMGSAAPGPYAHDGAAGAVYPPAGIEAGTPGGASQWSGHYQGLPDAMANVSLGPSQEPQPPTV